MRRFFAPEGARGGRIVLRGREAYHLAVVLRLRPGERVIAVDGAGREHVVQLTAVSVAQAEGEVLEIRQGAAAVVEVTLVQGVPKGAKMDAVIRMGTELGIRRFIPALTSRAVAEGRGRAERWRRIAVEAAKQSRRSEVPEVLDPMPFAAALDHLEGCDLVLALWEGERARSIADVLGGAAPHRLALLVGPEGGFTAAEVEDAVRRGAHVVSLGPRILRTETAALAAAAMVLYEFTLRRV
ncbi:MAG TPA: RsmE family RNA methyltransferase [bacterium]|nr:RsmE family RNA methyltransferase [bacterium]